MLKPCGSSLSKRRLSLTLLARIFAVTCRRCWGGRLLPLEPPREPRAAPPSPCTSRQRRLLAPPLATAATTRWWTPLHRPAEDVYRPRDQGEDHRHQHDEGVDGASATAPPLVLPPTTTAAVEHHHMQLPLGMGKTCSKSAKSAVVRARYVPDVKGVNRYKHFHR